MAKRKWKKSSLPMAAGHGWKGAPGCRIFVATAPAPVVQTDRRAK